MHTQNITLSISKELLAKAKLLAVQRHTSVSGLLAQALEGLVEHADTYAAARRRHSEWLARGANLGTGGRPLVAARDELHERH
jgi:hypothetical protein